MDQPRLDDPDHVDGRAFLQDPWFQLGVAILWGFAVVDALTRDTGWLFRGFVIVWGVAVLAGSGQTIRKLVSRRPRG